MKGSKGNSERHLQNFVKRCKEPVILFETPPLFTVCVFVLQESEVRGGWGGWLTVGQGVVLI